MFAIALHTEKMPSTPGGAIQGRISYKVFADTGAKGKMNPQILTASLLPGMNLAISADDLEIIRASQMGKTHIERGIIEIIAPAENHEGEGLTLDFDEPTALRLIAETYDRDWIDRSVTEETRIPIKTALRERMRAIQDELDELKNEATVVYR